MVRTAKATSLLLEQHEATIRTRLMKGILAHEELSPNAHGSLFIYISSIMIGVNTNTGETREIEFRTIPQTVRYR